MRLFSTGMALAIGAMTATEILAQNDNEVTIFGEEGDFDGEQGEFEEVQEEEPVQIERVETTAMPFNFFSTLDFSMGMIIGFYSPIQQRWRNWDCRSRFFDLAIKVVKFSKYWDKPYELTVGGAVGSLVELSFLSFASLVTYDTCNAQYEEISDGSNNWLLNFQSEDTAEKAGYTTAWAHPMVSEEPTGDIATFAHALVVVLNLNGAIGNFNSHYYYFFTGLALGGFFGQAFTFADSQLELGIITPENPWERYNQP